MSTRRQSREEKLSARLALIRKRHHELILQPREAIAADLDSEFEDASQSEELELVSAAESGG
jgi:hypothetical protein